MSEILADFQRMLDLVDSIPKPAEICESEYAPARPVYCAGPTLSGAPGMIIGRPGLREFVAWLDADTIR